MIKVAVAFLTSFFFNYHVLFFEDQLIISQKADLNSQNNLIEVF